MNTNIFSLSPFCSPRSKVTFPKFAILLNEQGDDKSEKHNSQSARSSSLSEELLPKQSTLEPTEDVVASIGALLQAKIKDHAGEDSSLFTAAEVMKKNSSGLVPLMYRIASEDFAKSCRSQFKIIECRNATKLVSDWKPSLPDTLIALKHQVIVVQLKDFSFLPYNDFVYAVLRQIDHEWKLRMPQSFFYPNDVCKVEATQDRNLIVVTPSMPDGDLEVSRKMSTLNYELIMMFKRSCMGAMKNYLLMRDMRVGKLQDTVDSVAAIRAIYKKLQDQLRGGGEIRMGSCSGSTEDLNTFMKQNPTTTEALTTKTLLEYSKKLGIERQEPEVTMKHEIIPTQQEKFSSKMENDNGEREFGIGMQSAPSSAREPLLNLDYSILDKKLSAEFSRIEALISGNNNIWLDPEGDKKLVMENIQSNNLKDPLAELKFD